MGGNRYFTLTTLMTLHEAVEYYLVELFTGPNLGTIYTKRVTLLPLDVQLLRCFRGEYDCVHENTQNFPTLSRPPISHEQSFFVKLSNVINETNLLRVS